jgi:hypothetical protein
MTVQITPFLTLAVQYGSLLDWKGDLAVHTVHVVRGRKSQFVTASDIVDLTEAGVLIAWRGDDPTGVFIPWGEIVCIEQAAAGG